MEDSMVVWHLVS